MESKIYWIKIFCLVILIASGLFIISRFILISKAQSICPFPVKGNYNLTNTCYTTSTTGIEEGRLNVPTTTLNINPNTNFIYNPGYGIDLGSGSINFQSSSTPGNIKKGYLCVQDNDNDGCWLNPTFSTSSSCFPTTFKRYSNFVTTFPTNYWGDCNDNSNQQCYLLNEICGDDIDNNCDGFIDEGCYFGCLGMGGGYSAVAYQDKIYYLGGSQFLEYDPLHDSWKILRFPSELFNSISGHSAVVYQDKMYVFGGLLAYPGASSSYLSNSLFEYNFLTRQWREIPSSQPWYQIPSPRRDFGATVYQDKMYIYGGDIVPYTSDELWEYNFQSNIWTFKRKMADDISQSEGSVGASFGMVLDEIRGKLYFIGGNTESIVRSPPNRIYGYSFNDNRFYIEATLNNFPYPSSGALRFPSAVMYQNKMYIFGGLLFSGGEENNSLVSNRLIVFDPATKTWQEKSPDIYARYGHKAVVVGSKMYVFSGLDANGQVLQDLRIYDFNTDTWLKGSFGPISRYNHSAIVYNNKMYIYGGLCGTHELPRRDLKSFDFNSNSWTYESNGPRYKDSHSAVVFNNKMYLWGNGKSFTNYPSEGENDYIMLVYDFLNKTWSSYNSASYFLTDTERYMGGKNRYAYIASNKMYKAGEYSYRNFGVEDSRINHKKLLECTLEPPNERRCRIPNSTGIGSDVVNREDGYSTIFFNNQRYIYGGIGGGCNFSGICDDRAYHSAVLEGGRMYIFGGYGPFNLALSSLKVRDMVTGSWTTLASDSIPRYGHSAVIYQNKMYIVGGITTDGIPLGDARIYNITTNSWQAGIPEPQR
ncbi:MAG: hypothetical protein NC828_02200 [Candidatus Omnitrophica bacterium]|nr:hypothetical protein [Candidatus Omnitrophota bacterium]